MERKWSRRSVGRLMLAAPLAAAAGGSLFTQAARAAEQEPASPPPDPEPTPLAKFLAKEEEGLSGEERKKVRRNVTQLERGLKAIRDFKLSNDVPPAGTFSAMRSRPGRG